MSTHKFNSPVMGWLGAGVAMGLALMSVPLIDSPAQAGSAGIFNPAILHASDGRQIFEQVCQGCHMSEGRGAVGAGRYPALANDRALVSKQYMALTLLLGRRNMPAFGARHAIGFGGPPATLTNEQIAAVINYVRTHFDNRYRDSITAAEVAALDLSPH